MSVTEAKMGWGDFTIPLREETPRSIIRLLDLKTTAFGLIRITPEHIDPAVMATTRARDLFAGPIMRRPDRHTIEGHHVTMYLGENSGSTELYSEEFGPISSLTPIAHSTSTGSLTNWVTDILDIPACAISLAPGGVLGSKYIAGTTRGAIFVRKAPKTLLDSWLTHRFGVVYQVRNDLYLDIGLTTQVWPATLPLPVAVRRGGRDLNVQGLNAVELNLETDYADWASRVICYIETPSALGEAYSTNPFNSPKDGSNLNWTRLVSGQSASQTSTAVAQEDATNQAEDAIVDAVRTRQVTLSAKEYAITRGGAGLQRVAPGHLIYVYDTDEGLFDQGNTVSYQGKTIWPMELRVESVTWPLQQGQGIYLDNRHNTGGSDVVDLTNYVDFAAEEETDTTITVGAPQRTLGRMLRRRK